MTVASSRGVWLLTFLYCRAWLIFHFVCTALYLAPVGELKVRTFDLVTSYIEPRFAQRWSLFAPDPDGISRHLLIACKLRHPEGTHETPLFDLTEPLYSAPWRTRLGPGYRLMRTYLATGLVFEGDSAQLDVLEYQAKSDPETAKELRPELARRREIRVNYTQRLAVRIASAECKTQFPDAAVFEVHPVIDIIRAPARRASDPAPDAPVRLDFGWHRYEGNVRSL